MEEVEFDIDFQNYLTFKKLERMWVRISDTGVCLSEPQRYESAQLMARGKYMAATWRMALTLDFKYLVHDHNKRY